jgi:predicted ATPase
VEEEGAATKGIERIQEGLRRRPPQGRIAQTYCQALLAEAYGKAGMPKAGIEELKTAQAAVEATEERFFEAELNRLQGELLRQAGVSDQEAEQYFLQALAIARTQSARSLELRATISLARLRQEQGKEEEGRVMLSKIYDGFSEGLETEDLRDARAFIAAHP